MSSQGTAIVSTLPVNCCSIYRMYLQIIQDVLTDYTGCTYSIYRKGV